MSLTEYEVSYPVSIPIYAATKIVEIVRGGMGLDKIDEMSLAIWNIAGYGLGVGIGLPEDDTIAPIGMNGVLPDGEHRTITEAIDQMESLTHLASQPPRDDDQEVDPARPIAALPLIPILWSILLPYAIKVLKWILDRRRRAEVPEQG